MCGCLMLQSVLVGFFCYTAQLGLVVFGTLMKKEWDKMWLFLSEGIVCVIGLSNCFLSRAQNGCVKFAVQALLNWQRRKSILKMSGSGVWSFHRWYFACFVFLI